MGRYAPFLAVAVVLAALVLVAVTLSNENRTGGMEMGRSVELPDPKAEGEVSLERTIASRRSRRSFTDQALTLQQAGQVLWSAQGITEGRFRAAPSAGATYPLEVFIAVGDGTVEGLEAGVYLYKPDTHVLSQVLESDIRSRLAAAALRQGFVGEAPMAVVIAADYDRTTGRYGERGRRYVHMEVGHVGGNIYLQCEALGLGTVAVGAFNDDEVESLLDMPDNLDALYIMPVGYTR